MYAVFSLILIATFPAWTLFGHAWTLIGLGPASAGAVGAGAAEEAGAVVGGVDGGGGVHRHTPVHHRGHVLHRAAVAAK